ncbi:hypothetical protein EC845_4349 [Comamonas sp. BIGb0124]|nr:hypothetical protein EC845_4349 [Comamonas sp. BIGb0124]
MSHLGFPAPADPRGQAGLHAGLSGESRMVGDAGAPGARIASLHAMSPPATRTPPPGTAAAWASTDCSSVSLAA